MIKNASLKITLFSLFGLAISAISLTSGVWVIRATGRSQTAIDLWVSLSSAFTNTELLTNTDRQQAILVWLSIIFAGFALQVLATIFIFHWRKRIGWSISAVLWAVILAAAVVLMVSYHAVVSGVMWLVFGSALALAGELWIIFSESNFQQREHVDEIPVVEKRWSAILKEAREQAQSFSVLAVSTSPSISSEELQRLQAELRGRDLIYPVQNGMFVLLWQINPQNTALIASKIMNVLQGHSTREVSIGSAGFPTDGKDLHSLLGHAVAALKTAEHVGGSAVVAFSAPAGKDARGILAPWEELLVEAASARCPVSLIYFQTSRPLSLSEKQSIQKELRGRDRVVVFENGFYAFLWDTGAEGAPVVVAKLQKVVTAAKIENQPATARFPEDGQTLTQLLAVLDLEAE